MKRLATVFISIFAFAAVALADDRPISFEQLPLKARQFITAEFPQDKVALTTVDREITGDSYEVRLVSGTKIEFSHKGEWTEISGKLVAVDEKFIPEKIREYVSSTYPGAIYLKIERGRNGYEVDLSNGLELTFNRHFALVDIDD